MTLRSSLTLALTAMAVASQAQVLISVDPQQRGPQLSPVHYGIFYEDINHAADGGIYAELIRNRSFEDSEKLEEGWTLSASDAAKLTGSLTSKGLLNEAQGRALQLQMTASDDAPVILVNEGFWGINSVQGREYKLSFFAKGSYKGNIKARLQGAEGEVYAETTVVSDKIGKSWTKYTATLKAGQTDPKAQLALVMTGKGQLTLDVVSLFPPTFKNRENGLRPDLAQMLYEMHPKFMRFPGGCFVEGQVTADNAFRWERTIGPIETRPGHANVNWGYRTTDGLGFHEYLQMAEDLGAKPLYVVNVGIWHGGFTPVDSIQPWIDETLCALEYANGDVTTKYGAMRAANGHPEPFNIEYLEIGNENNQPDANQQSDHYYDRFRLFKQAILAKYPKMHLIGNVVAWGDDNPKWETDETVEYVDEHYYRSPAWFTEHYNHYDQYDRQGPKVYCGEYAVTSNFGNLGNMNAALGEAVFMMGMENNADVVEMNSYAPIFVNENDAKWRPDMIRFSSSKVMGTPSYYVQTLLAQNAGTQMVASEMNNPYDLTEASEQVTPAKSGIGYATWATKSTFTKPVVEGSTSGSASSYTTVSGQWEQQGDMIAQTSDGTPCMAVVDGVENGDHYSVSFRARKDEGREGFMVMFNYLDPDNYCWLNFGGWANTQHGIEQVTNGGKFQVAGTPGSLETDRWYDVRLDVAGDSLRAYLDGEMVIETQLQAATKSGLFSNAMVDDHTGETIVKIVNTSRKTTTARIDLKGQAVEKARLIQLRANDGMDENTLLQPTNIHPTERQLSPNGQEVEVEVPAYSLSIVRIK